MIRTMIASCLLACSGFVSAQMTGGNPEEVKQTAPAPLYRDPVYDGVADPVVVWNKEDRSWWQTVRLSLISICPIWRNN